jgi:hypothetical protein
MGQPDFSRDVWERVEPARDATLNAVPLRRCYLCGRGGLPLVPLGTPSRLLCASIHCAKRFGQLPRHHCQARDLTGQLCGRPLGSGAVAGGQGFCSFHQSSSLREATVADYWRDDRPPTD